MQFCLLSFILLSLFFLIAYPSISWLLALDYKQLFFIIDQPGVSYFVKYIVHGVLSSNEAYMIVWGLILSNRIIISWTPKSPIAYALTGVAWDQASHSGKKDSEASRAIVWGGGGGGGQDGGARRQVSDAANPPSSN